MSGIWPNWSQYKPYQYVTQMYTALAVKCACTATIVKGLVIDAQTQQQK
jgi:translation initiation factor 1 (eIF-1/SUI1)